MASISSARMLAQVQAGGLVWYRGKQITRVLDVPSQTQIDSDDAAEATDLATAATLRSEIKDRIDQLAAIGQSYP